MCYIYNHHYGMIVQSESMVRTDKEVQQYFENASGVVSTMPTSRLISNSLQPPRRPRHQLASASHTPVNQTYLDVIFILNAEKVQ